MVKSGGGSGEPMLQEDKRFGAGEETDFIADLVAAEIRRIVAEAGSDGGMLSASECAARILRTYPGCGLRETQIADRVMMAAAGAGIAVEIGPQ